MLEPQYVSADLSLAWVRTKSADFGYNRVAQLVMAKPTLQSIAKSHQTLSFDHRSGLHLPQHEYQCNYQWWKAIHNTRFSWLMLHLLFLKILDQAVSKKSSFSDEYIIFLH